MADEIDNETEKEFYDNIAKVADTVNRRLHGSVAPGGTNAAVTDQEEPPADTQIDLEQDDNYFPL